MAEVNKEIAIKVTTDTTQSNKAVMDAEQQLGELKKQLIELAVQGKQNTAEFKAMSQQAGVLKANIEQVEQTVDGLAKSANQIEVFSGAVQGIAAGFALAQGAAALFAEGDEELQRALVRTQAAIALLQGAEQGLQLLRRESAAGQALLTARTLAYNAAVGSSTGALKLFRIALISTGIGAAIALIATLVVNWDKLTAAINPATKALKEYDDETVRFEETSKIRNEAIELEIRKLEALGASLLDVNTLRKEAVKTELEQIDRQLAKQQEAFEKSVQTAIEQRTFFTKLGVSAVSNWLGVSDENLKELDAQIDKIKSKRAELSTQLLELDRVEIDERKRIRDEETKRQEEEFKKRVDIETAAIRTGLNQFKEIQIEKGQIIVDENARQVSETFKTAETTKAIDLELARARIAIIQAMFGGFSELATSFANNNSKNAKALFNVSKALAIAETLVNTYRGAQDAFASTPGGIIIKSVAAGAAVASGLARVNNIRKQQFNAPTFSAPPPISLPSLGTGTTTQPPRSFESQQTNLNGFGQATPNNGQPQGQQRVIVVERDIREVRNRVDSVERFATFG